MDLSFLKKLNDEIGKNFSLLKHIDSIKWDGSVNRFDSTKNGDQAIWVCVHSWEFKGNTYYKAIYGNWRAGTQFTVTSYDGKQSQSKDFREHEKKKFKETQERLDKEKEDKHRACREKWAPIYFSLPQNSNVHQYLKNKKINSNFHARVDDKDVLYVPAWNSEGVFVGAQRIFLDPVENKFEKKFTFGIEITGSFCPFGDIRNAEFIYIAEGFATAASIYMAFKDNPKVAVACVWNTNNIMAGTNAVRRINPNSYLVFAADRDINADPRWHNIGERKAIQAANKISNSIVKTVKFDSGNDQWSDYNDLHQFEGIDKVAKQLSVESSDFIEIIPLGYNEDRYYYFSTARKQILEFTKGDHNPSHFMLHAPSKYWGDRFGYLYKADGEKTKNPDWKIVIEKLGMMISKAGVFNFSNVRGLGAWEVENDAVVNLGDKLYHKNDFYPLHNNGIDSKHFYQSREPVVLDFTRPLGNSDSIKIVEAFSMLNYKNKSDAIIILGWIFSAQIFAALPWRPHIWITGERGCGKSTILGYINQMLDLSMILQSSTAAGIRQSIGDSARPVVYDESEPNTDKERERINEILAMVRECSTGGKGYKSARGSASGKAILYNTNSCFCFGSIQLSQMGGADTSRFFVVEMESNKDQRPEDFVRVENAMAEIAPLSSGLMVRAVNMYKKHVANIETAKSYIKGRKIESRQADQLAPIIAGYWAFFSTELMDEKFVEDTIREMQFEQSEYVRANKENDSERCLFDILEIQIPGRSISVGQILEKYPYITNINSKDEYDQMLGLVGVRYFEKEKDLFIASGSSSLRNQMQKMSKFSDYKSVLKRHEKFKEFKACRVAGRVINGAVISFESFTPDQSSFLNDNQQSF